MRLNVLSKHRECSLKKKKKTYESNTMGDLSLRRVHATQQETLVFWRMTDLLWIELLIDYTHYFF